jgi:trehalose 6-phosphate phosphatase
MNNFQEKMDLERLNPILGQKKIGIFCDFDGTLSPIVADPSAAEINPVARELLVTLRDLVTVVGIISGRKADDLSQRIMVDGLTYIGNHGLERIQDGQRIISKEAKPYLTPIEKAAEEIEAILLPAMQLERKEATLSIHYRQTSDPQKAREQTRQRLESVAHQYGLKLFEGRMIFELRPPIEIDKGSILMELIEVNHLDAAVFIGDDITDTAAFRAASKLRNRGICLAYSVGVLDSGTPPEVRELADLTVPGVYGVVSLLSWLANRLSASST